MTGEDSTHASLPRTRTVERALALLAEVAANDGLGLIDVARRVDLSPATALRLLRTLESSGYVLRDSGGSYYGGRRLIQVAATFMGSVPLYGLAERHLADLRDETGETAYLGVFGPGDTALYARLAESGQSIRHVSWLGKTVPLDGTAVGTALQDRCGDRGYFATRHTLEDNATAIAASVYWPDGSVAAALSVVGPTFRISDAQVQAFGDIVVAHARELAKELGAPTPNAHAMERDA